MHLMTWRKEFNPQYTQLALLSAQRYKFVEGEQHRRSEQVVRKVRFLDDSHRTMEYGENVECVEQLVRDPERVEDVDAGGCRGEDVDYADDDNKKDTRETLKRNDYMVAKAKMIKTIFILGCRIALFNNMDLSI